MDIKKDFQSILFSIFIFIPLQSSSKSSNFVMKPNCEKEEEKIIIHGSLDMVS